MPIKNGGLSARAASGHPTATPLRRVMNSRRLMDLSPRPKTTIYHIALERSGFVHDSRINSPMSPSGQRRSLRAVQGMSADRPVAELPVRPASQHDGSGELLFGTSKPRL